METLNLFHSTEIFWKYCKRLENPISIVVSNSITWKCFCGMEIFLKYSRNISGNITSIPDVEEVQLFQCGLHHDFKSN